MTQTVSRVLAGLATGLAVFLAFLLERYFLPPHIPRFRVEAFFIWFVAIGVLAILTRPGTREPRPLPVRPIAGWHYLAMFAGFAIVAVLEYAGALGVGFLSDDFVIADWASRREWIHAAETGFVRPVVPMAWGLLSFLPFEWSATLHAANLLLHAGNAVLVAAIAARLGATRAGALAAGVLFLTLAAMTEAVVWISGMQDVLMTTFGLAAVVAALDVGGKSMSAGALMPPAAIFSAALALGVKETAIVVPILAWTAAWASPAGIERGPQRQTLLAMTTVAILYAAARAAAGLASGYGEGVSRYFFKQLIVDPFATLGAPWSTAWLQAHPWVALARACLLVAILAAAFLAWRRGDSRCKVALVCAAWVLVAVAPVFSFFHVSAVLEGSRYLYLPAAGFSLLVARLINELARRAAGTLAPVVTAVAVAALAIPTLASSRAEVARWTGAARLRDEVLTAYVRVMPPGECGSFVADGLVDNVDGAFVLRNGFSQALREMGAAMPAAPSGPRCRIEWADHLVVRQEP